MNSKIVQHLSHKIFVDQIENTVLLNKVPQRIVCLVPSITELLFYLGLVDRVVGITKFCIHPNEWFTTKDRIGGTKNINIKKILSLQPDLIIANKEENVKEQVETLALSVPIYTSDVKDLPTAFQMILHIGKLTNTEKKALGLIKKIKKKFAFFDTIRLPKNVLYLIWRNPFITIGGDTFINYLLHIIGLQNIFLDYARYPTIELNSLALKKIDFIFLSSEPYPFKKKHIFEIKKIFPETKVVLVNGEMFSWYGSRLLKAANYLKILQTKIYK